MKLCERRGKKGAVVPYRYCLNCAYKVVKEGRQKARWPVDRNQKRLGNTVIGPWEDRHERHQTMEATLRHAWDPEPFPGCYEEMFGEPYQGPEADALDGGRKP